MSNLVLVIITYWSDQLITLMEPDSDCFFSSHDPIAYIFSEKNSEKLYVPVDNIPK